MVGEDGCFRGEVRPVALRSRLDSRFSDICVDPESPVSKHRQVYAALRSAILEGKLEADDALPSTRELATELGVSRNTVLTAYELLSAEGFVVPRGGAGTFVAANATRIEPPAQRERIEPRPLSSAADKFRVWRVPTLPSLARPFSPSSPAFDAFPYAAWSRIAARITRHSSSWTPDGDPLGHLPLRKAIAQHLQLFRACSCDPDQIMVVSGSQLGLFLCSMLLVDPNDPVWIEEPGYPQARLAFRVHTERIIPVPLDDAGIDIEAGKALSPHPH